MKTFWSTQGFLDVSKGMKRGWKGDEKGWKGAFRRNELKLATQNLLKVLQNVLIHRSLLNLSSNEYWFRSRLPHQKDCYIPEQTSMMELYHENRWQFLVISITDVWQCLKYASAKSFPVTGFSWFLLTIAVLIFKNEVSMFPLAQKKAAYSEVTLYFYNSLLKCEEISHLSTLVNLYLSL